VSVMEPYDTEQPSGAEAENLYRQVQRLRGGSWEDANELI
jgi:hypothetical protein